MSNKIKLLFVLLTLNSTLVAQSSWVYPDNTINDRFLDDALSYSIKRPGLSINGFTGSNHGLGIKEILVKYAQNDSTVIKVHNQIVNASDLSIIYYSGIPSSVTLKDLLEIYNDNAKRIEARAYVALLTYIIERNGGNPLQFGISRSHNQALIAFKDAIAINNNLVSWDLVKRYNYNYAFTEGNIDFVKFTQSFMNIARALDIYLGLENAYKFYGSKCTPNNPLITYCDSVAEAEYSNTNSTSLLSQSQKTALFQKYGDALLDFQAVNNATIGDLHTWYPPTPNITPQFLYTGLIVAIGSLIDLKHVQPGNWSLKNFIGTGYGAMAIQVINPQNEFQQYERQQYENMYDNALNVVTVQSESNRLLYWNYQTNNGQSYWAEGPYYMHYSFREVIPFLHAVRMNNAWNPNSSTPDPFVSEWFLKPLNWLANIATPDGSTPPIDDGNKHPMRHSDMLRWAPTYGDANTGRKFAKINDAIHEYQANTTRYATESSVLLVTLAIPRISDDQNIVLNDLTNSTNDDQQLVIRRQSKGKEMYILLNGERGSAITRGEGHEQPDQLQLLIYADDQSLIGDSGYDMGGIQGNSTWNGYGNNNNLMIYGNNPHGGLASPYMDPFAARKKSEHASVSNLSSTVDGRITIMEGSVLLEHFTQLNYQNFSSKYNRTVLYIDEDSNTNTPGYIIDFNTSIRGAQLAHHENIRFDIKLKYTIPGLSINPISSSYWNRYLYPSGFLALFVQPIEWGLDNHSNWSAYLSNSLMDIREYNGSDYSAHRLGLEGPNFASRSWTSMSIIWFDGVSANQTVTPQSQPLRINTHSASNVTREYSSWYLPISDDIIDVYIKRAYPDGNIWNTSEINFTVPVVYQTLKLTQGSDYGFARFKKIDGFWYPISDYQLNIEVNSFNFENNHTITNATYPTGTNLRVEHNKTLTINGHVSFGSDTRVFLGVNSKIIVTSTGKITSEGTQFSSVDHTNSAMAYNRIELKSSGNEFVNSSFRGGNNENIYLNSIDANASATFTSTTLSHSKNGITIHKIGPNSAEAILIGSTITQNTVHGAYVNGGTLRLNGYTRELPSNEFWEKMGYDPTSIHGNTGNGVTLIGSGKLYTSHSRVMDNTGIQISVGNDARMYAQEMNQVSLPGLNRISKTTSGYYIYSTARTPSGETYQNWTIPARYNYWGGGSEPVAGRFFGPVDATFKLTSDETVPYITLTCLVSNCDGKEELGQIASILTSAMSKSIAEGAITSEESERLIVTKERILAIRNHISSNPDDPFNARLLREWHGLLQSEGASTWSDEKQLFAERLETRKTQHAADMVVARNSGRRAGSGRETNAPSDLFRPDSELDPKHLIGETAWILSLAGLAENGQFEQLLTQAGSFGTQIFNADNRASVQMYRMQALQSLGRYDEAIDALNELERIQPNADMQPHYIAQDYDPVRRYLAELAGVDVNATLAKSNATIDDTGTPHTFALHPSYPNPFNPTTTVRYSVGGGNGSSVPVRIAVFDLLGREVAVLVDERKQVGEYTQLFDAAGVASGIYLIHARLGTQLFSQKITLIK